MKLILLEKKIEAKDTVSFWWKAEQKISFLPGQYIYYTVPKLPFDDPRGNSRQFTIASSPTEDNYLLTTRIRKESAFKQTLSKMEPGDKIDTEGPHGSFVLDETLNGPQILFAGGIGITPFRSFIKYATDKKLDVPIYLIYSNSDTEFVYKNELDLWQKNNQLLTIHYHNSGKYGHLDKLKIEKLIENWKTSAPMSLEIENFSTWIVGPRGFVSAMEELLEKLGVDDNKIQTEKFIGY